MESTQFNATPYIILAITQTILFVVWIVKQTIDFNKKFAKMETQINSQQKEIDAMKQDQKETLAKLSVLSELMAVCKNTVDWMLAKAMKKGLA